MNNPFNVCIQTVMVGDDYLFLITGGKAHIGAVSTAFQEGGTAVVRTQIIPGHKEGELAEEMARLAEATLHRTVTVVMGIHVDQASKEDIRHIVELVPVLMKRELDRLTQEVKA